jgi:hypothetical protein
MNKRKFKLKASIRRQRPYRGDRGLTREPVRVVSTSGLTHPVTGKLGCQLAER